MTSEPKKPLGITLMAVCAALFGIGIMPLGCTGLMLSQAPGAGAYLTILSLIVFATSALLISASYGLWTFQEWGRNLFRWMCIASIPLGLISIFPVWPGQRMSLGNAILQIAGIVLNVVMIQYLTRPDVVERYSGAPAPGPDRVHDRREPRL